MRMVIHIDLSVLIAHLVTLLCMPLWATSAMTGDTMLKHQLFPKVVNRCILPIAPVDILVVEAAIA